MGPSTRARLAQLNVDLKSAGAPLAAVKAAAARENVTTSSHLISLGVKRCADPTQQHEDFAALAGGVQNASLFLCEKGVACKWSTGAWTKHARTYEVIGVDLTEVILEGCLMIGRARQTPPAPTRPDLARHLRRTD